MSKNTAAVGIIVAALAYFGYEVSPDVQEALNTVITYFSNLF